MTLYLSQGRYTPEAIAAQIRNPQDRIEILRPGVEKAGGRIVAYGYLDREAWPGGDHRLPRCTRSFCGARSPDWIHRSLR